MSSKYSKGEFTFGFEFECYATKMENIKKFKDFAKKFWTTNKCDIVGSFDAEASIHHDGSIRPEGIEDQGSSECPDCNGTGSYRFDCSNCDGDGCGNCDDRGYFEEECETCGGSGEISSSDCGSYGAEICSPVLRVTPLNYSKINLFFAKAMELDIHTNHSCGFHIHIGLPDKKYIAIQRFWFLCQLALDEKMCEFVLKFNKHKFSNNQYAQYGFLEKIRGYFNMYVEGKIETEENLYRSIRDYYSDNKYLIFRQHPQGTIEWRGPRGFYDNHDVSEIKDFFRTKFFTLIDYIGKTTSNPTFTYRDKTFSFKEFKGFYIDVDAPIRSGVDEVAAIKKDDRFTRGTRRKAIANLFKTFPVIGKNKFKNIEFEYNDNKTISLLQGMVASGVWHNTKFRSVSFADFEDKGRVLTVQNCQLNNCEIGKVSATFINCEMNGATVSHLSKDVRFVNCNIQRSSISGGIFIDNKYNIENNNWYNGEWVRGFYVNNDSDTNDVLSNHDPKTYKMMKFLDEKRKYFSASFFSNQTKKIVESDKYIVCVVYDGGNSNSVAVYSKENFAKVYFSKIENAYVIHDAKIIDNNLLIMYSNPSKDSVNQASVFVRAINILSLSESTYEVYSGIAIEAMNGFKNIYSDNGKQAKFLMYVSSPSKIIAYTTLVTNFSENRKQTFVTIDLDTGVVEKMYSGNQNAGFVAKDTGRKEEFKRITNIVAIGDKFFTIATTNNSLKYLVSFENNFETINPIFKLQVADRNVHGVNINNAIIDNHNDDGIMMITHDETYFVSLSGSETKNTTFLMSSMSIPFDHNGERFYYSNGRIFELVVESESVGVIVKYTIPRIWVKNNVSNFIVANEYFITSCKTSEIDVFINKEKFLAPNDTDLCVAAKVKPIEISSDGVITINVPNPFINADGDVEFDSSHIDYSNPEGDLTDTIRQITAHLTAQSGRSIDSYENTEATSRLFTAIRSSFDE